MKYKRVRKKITLLLALVMFGISIMPGYTAYAGDIAENIEEDAETDVIDENQADAGQDLNPDIQERETEQQQGSSDQEGNPVTGDTVQNEEVADTAAGELLLNRIVVDFPYLATPEEQKISLSFGVGTEAITDAKLRYQNQAGEQFELPLAERQKELYLFEKAFDASEAGVYELTDFIYTVDGEEITLNLEEIGANALFGVDEYYPGYSVGEEDIKDTDIDVSVVNVETDEVVTAETDVETAIEEAAAEVAPAPKTKARAASLSSRTKANNVVVVLDPGHGGSDSGAVGNGLLEKNLTLKIAQYCKAELEEYDGVTVYMTRESDVYSEIYDRVQKFASLRPNVLVSIHINSASAASANGVEVWYPNANYNGQVHQQGQAVSAQILQELVKLGFTNRGIQVRTNQQYPIYPDGSLADYYGIIRYSKNNGFPGIIVEHGFISNASDANKLRQDSFLKQCGIADATGIANYFGLSKNPTVKINNKNDFKGTGEISYAGCKGAAEVRVYNENNPSNVKTYPVTEGRGTIGLNIADYNGAGGKYIVGVYDGTGTLICSTACNFSSDSSSRIEITSADEITYNAKLIFADMPDIVKGVQFPSWSRDDQGDIIWHNAVQTSAGVWEVNIKASNYNKAGTFPIHCYAILTDGSPYLLGGTGITITKPSATLRIDNVNTEEGTFDAVVENIVSPSGVKQIQIPVWHAQDQSDIKWYTATKQGNAYVAHISIANHNYAIGQYNIHGYITAGNGLYSFLGRTTQQVDMPDLEISVTDTDQKQTRYAMTATNPGVLGLVKGIQFAVWSEKGGQDDLIWYQGVRNTSGIWTATADITRHRTAGQYQMHVYASMADGRIILLGKETFEVKNPETTARVEGYDAKTGTFDVVVEVDKASVPSGIESVQVPVWCAANQSDLKWYTAEKEGDGKYKAHVSMANHNCAVGTYSIHTYVATGNGIYVYTGKTAQKVDMPDLEISVTDTDQKQTRYAMTATNPGVLGLVKGIQFAVWSEKGGQDDLIWYQGVRNTSGIWTATADITRHRTAGQYQMHVYASMADGRMILLGKKTFEVEKPSGIKVNLSECDKDSGEFIVTISDIQSMSDVKEVEVPVWCEANQSDIKWYIAEKVGDQYVVHVDPAFHGYHSGTYNVHVYVTTTNEVQSFMYSGTKAVTAAKYYTIMGESTVTVAQMVAYYKSSGKSYPAIYASKGAPTLDDFCRLYMEEAKAEGVRAEVAFTQAMKETGWLQFGGIVQSWQCNFAGIGALDGNATGNCATFPDVRTGIRAQIQHLKAYGSTEPLRNVCVDPRFNLVRRGVAPYVEYLGINDYPVGIGWATAKGYGFDIVKMIRTLKGN